MKLEKSQTASLYRIEINHLSHTYTQGSETVRILDDITLHIKPGERVGILGPSGSGKSTLLHLIALLMPRQSGTIILDGVNLDTIPWHQRSGYRGKNIGFIFQAYGLLQDFSAHENVMMAARLVGIVETKARTQAETMLERVGLQNRLHHRPHQLSGGEQQRVALARALVHQPRLILADEPTGNLDQRSSHVVFETLTQACRQERSTLLMVTHDEKLAQQLDTCYRLDQGKLYHC